MGGVDRTTPTPGALIHTAAEITPSVSHREVKFKARHSRRLSLFSKELLQPVSRYLC